jgi:hypothetical protein
MKSLIFIVALLSGCATTKIGDLEVLNDMGRSGKATGSVLRTADSSCKVLTGHSCDSQQLNTPQINRTYGEIKQLPDYRRASLPQILQQLQTIVR